MGTNYRINQILCTIFLLIIFTSPTSMSLFIRQKELHSDLVSKYSDSEFSDLVNYDNIIDVFNSPPHLSYVQIDSLQGDGASFDINDKLEVSHVQNMYLNSSNNWNEPFSISGLNGYSNDYLKFGLTVMGTRDNYTVQTGTNRGQGLDSSQIRVAQGFQIHWDYGVFYGAQMLLQETGPSLGGNELDLFVVKADSLNQPNMSDIRAVAAYGPYNSTNHLPSSTWEYYDFIDVTHTKEAVLEEGQYFVVANLSKIDDGSDSFFWEGNIATMAGYPMYRYIGSSWSAINQVSDLIIDIKPSDINGFDKIFSDITEISLEDGSSPITSLDQQILTTGPHTLYSGRVLVDYTSVFIQLNNTYTFSRTLVASSRFSVSSSNYLSESVNWSVTWNSGTADILTYSNPIREFSLSPPTDWNNQSFGLLMNEIDPFSGEYVSQEFVFDVSSFISESEYLDNSFNFTTTSLNYMKNLILDSSEYNLGYWTANETHAIGHIGSSVTADVYVKDGTLDGDLNFTLYDPNGNIVDKKNESDYTNVIFTDISSYTYVKINQTTPGHYKFNTSFDPSINGSDLEGYWTAVGLWSNDTEVGFYSIQISVSKSTSASFLWEETLGGNMTNNTLTPIVRKNLDPVTVQVLYCNVSDLYTVGEIGKPIGAADVTYNTSWGTSGDLNYNGSHYVLNIPINVSVGDYSVTLTATGTLLETHSITFDLTVYHTFAVNNIVTHSPYYYNNPETTIHFDVVDTSSSPVELILPDEINVYLDGDLLTVNSEFVYVKEGNSSIRLELQTSSDALNLYPGSYELNITVSKDGFFDDYGKPTTSTITTFTILEAPTRIDIMSADTEIYYGNETTVIFNFINTESGDKIPDADFEVSFDIDEAELIDQYEVNGDYYIVFRVLDSPATSVHVFITISATGYQSIIDFSITSITLNNPNKGIPPFLYGLIGVLALIAITAPTVFILRRRVEGSKRREKALFTRIYGIYESVLSITKLIAVHKATGLPVYEMDLGSEISLDPSLITGFLTAISSMGIELRGDRAGSVKRLQYKNFYVTGSESGNFTIYTFSETELNEEIEEKLTVVSDWFAKMFSQIGEDWDGSTEVFRTNLQGITEKIMKEIHLWIFYPFIISPYKATQVEEFNGLRKFLATYIMNHDHVTISSIFDDLENVKIEKGLPIIFEFIEEGILTPVFDAYKIATVRF